MDGSKSSSNSNPPERLRKRTLISLMTSQAAPAPSSERPIRPQLKVGGRVDAGGNSFFYFRGDDTMAAEKESPAL
jgi:hypothetical protein